MATITFDTHKFISKLRKAGVPEHLDLFPMAASVVHRLGIDGVSASKSAR